MSSITDGEMQIGILAAALNIEGVGADGVLPPEASNNGAKLLIPMWINPSVKPGNGDRLSIWVTELATGIETLFYSNRFPVPVTIPAFFLLPAQYLQRDGEISLKYRVIAEDHGNEDTSLPQQFTVKRQVPVNLAELIFPSATLWGYLNCSSKPSLWEAVIVRVPAQQGRFAKDDVCAMDWEGFYNLNAVGPIPGTALRITKTLTQADAEQGFEFRLESDKYELHIKPMKNNASALASYTLYRGGIALGKSKPGLVKIDRAIPGESNFCEPTQFGGMDLTAVNAAPIHTMESCNALVPGACSLQSQDTPSGNNNGNSIVNSLMECLKMNMQVKTGGGILAVSPRVENQLPDGRLTYKQLMEDKSITVYLDDVEDHGPEGAWTVDLLLGPKGAVFNPNDPTYVVATKEKHAQTGGDWSFPVGFTVDTAALKDKFDANGEYAPYELSFMVYDEYGNEDSAVALLVLVDLTAPYQSQPGGPNGTGNRPLLLTLGATFPAVINDAWLNDPANAGGLNLTVPTAFKKFEVDNDQVNFYISTQTTFSLMQGETVAFSGKLSASGVINISLDFLKALKEGTYFYSYNLKDLAGNISNNSAITTLFNRVLTPAPIPDLPRIPVTDGRTPITFSMVTPPNKVIMEIDYPKNSIPGDRIIPYITSDSIIGGGPIPLPEKPIPPAGTPGPLTFELDYAFWAEIFGDPNNPDEVECEYWYEMVRPTIQPNPVSGSAFCVINFAYAGPEQPNLPDKPNPNIPPVLVLGAGTPPPAPNTLTPAQAGVAATMEWPVWVDANRPVTGREIVKFYYQGKQVGGSVPVRVGDTTVKTPLPWDTIQAEGNGIKEAYITIEYPGSDNVMKQMNTTKVDVSAIVVNLPKAQIVVSAFRGATGALVPERTVTSINCPSLNHPVVKDGPMPPYQARSLRIRIPRDLNIPTGAMVTLEFEGRVSNVVGGAPIPNTQFTHSLAMPPIDPLVFVVPYEKVRLIQSPSTGGTRPPTRYAFIKYTVNGIESFFWAAVALLNSSLVYCEQERPEPTP